MKHITAPRGYRLGQRLAIRNVIAAACTSCLLVSASRAVDISWAGTGSSLFNLASNWNPAQIPASADVAIFNNNLAPGTVAFSAAASVADINLSNTSGSLAFLLNGNTVSATRLLLGPATGQVNTATFSGGTLNNSSTFSLGSNGSSGNTLAFTGLNTSYICGFTGTSALGPTGSNNNHLNVTGGAYFETKGNLNIGTTTTTDNSLTITNSRFTVLGGNRGVTVNQGTVTVTNSFANFGLLNANTAGNVSWVNFNSGTLMSRRVLINNGQPFMVGDGGSIPATYSMVFGNPTANFANGMVLNSNGRLTGGYSLSPVLPATPATITGNISGIAGAKVNPSSLGQPQITTDDSSFGRIDVVGNYDNTNIETTLDIADFPRQVIADTTPPFDPPTDHLNINGAFTHGGSVKLDLFDYVPPQDADYTVKVLSFTSEVGSSASTPVSFVNGSTPLTYAWQANDGLYVTAAKVTLPMTSWAFAGSENWGTGTNWSAGAASGVDSTATFGASAITSAATITLDAPQTVGRIGFSGTNAYTLAGATLTLDVSVIGSARLRATSGSHVILCPVVLNDTTGIDVSSGATLTISGAISGGSNRLVKLSAGVAVVGKVNAGQLDINDGTLRLSGNGSASGVAEVTGFSYGDLARLDVGDNGMVVNYTASDPSGDIRSALVSGSYGGAWNGPGIMSSTAGGTSGFGVGYARTADTGATTVFGTIAVDSTTVVVRKTYNGDSNLDGKVNTLDFNLLAGGFGSASPSWVKGDYDYDGDIDSVDFNSLVANYGKSLPVSAPSLGAVVPEPCGVAALALIGLAGLRRRSK